MKIIHLCDITNRKNSGVSVIVPKYVEHQSKWADVLLLNVNSEVVVPAAGNYRNIGLDEAISNLEGGFDKPDIIVIHDVYSVRLLRYYLKHVKGKYKYVAIPHGGLMRVSQKKSHIKKTIANMLFYRGYFAGAEAVQYLSAAEYNGSIHYNKKHLIIPNGISVPDTKPYTVNSGDGFSIIYIGRITPMQKGLDLLVEAVALDKEFFVLNNIRIDLYGADYKGGAAAVSELIAVSGLGNIISLNADGIYGADKTEALLSSDMFIQVSRWEGMPSGILEAFSLGLPVIVSKETGLAEDVLEADCGYVPELTAESILQSLKAAYANRGRLGVLSDNAYRLSKKYDWKVVAKRTVEEYERMV